MGNLTPTPVPNGDALVVSFLGSLGPRTRQAYAQDLESFRAFVGAASVTETTRILLSQGNGHANALALGYKNSLIAAGLRPATINRRLAALRSLVKLARTLGLVPWTLEVGGAKIDSERDLRGPGRAQMKQVLNALSQRSDPKSLRDLAILRLLYDLGLRRGEVTSLDLDHFDRPGRSLSVLGKGRESRVRLTLPDETAQALERWVAARGETAGPLLLNFDRAKKGLRINGSSLYRLVRGLGLGRPHGVRHSAITAALDLLGGDLRKAQKFSRHSDVRLLAVYDDNRQDLAGEVARLVAADI